MKNNMKKLIAIALLILPMLVFSQNTAPTDTVASIVNPQSVVISKKDGTTTITVSGTEKDPNYKYKFEIQNGLAADTVVGNSAEEEWGMSLPFLKNGRRKSFFISWGEDIFFDVVLPSSKNSGMRASIEGGFGRLVSFNWLPIATSDLKITFGIGTSARKISFNHDKRLYFNEGHLTLAAPISGEKVKASSIYESEIRLPLMLTMPIYKSFKVSLGAVGILNVYSDASSTVKRDDSKFKEEYKGLHQRILNCEFVGTLGFDDALGVTFHYRPLSDFGSKYGPNFKTLSVGITCNF